MLQEKYKIPELPLDLDLESKAVLQALVRAHRNLAELKGFAPNIPNQSVLISTLSLQEARESTAVESIITTQDDVFKSSSQTDEFTSPEAKEVHNYNDALLMGFQDMKASEMIISNRMIIKMYQVIKKTQAEYRRTTGTALRNDQSGETVYVPPQHYDDILRYMGNLEKYINTAEADDIDPLIKLAIIHHQFESIHPFSDGNGRLGRLIVALYLVKTGLLDLPILYLSRFINQNKDTYYRLLQDTRDTGCWETWILFILEGIETTARQTTQLIKQMRNLMAEFKTELRSNYSNIYSQDLLNNLFRHPYTRIDYVMSDLKVSRPTATRYLNSLASGGLLQALKVGKKKYYINTSLLALFIDG